LTKESAIRVEKSVGQEQNVKGGEGSGKPACLLSEGRKIRTMAKKKHLRK